MSVQLSTPVYLMNNLITYQHNSSPFLSEAVCACLEEQGLHTDQLTVNMKGAFKKTFSDDIAYLDIDDETQKITATIDINRDGLYDILPEGLFHQTRGMQAIRTVQDAVKEHRKYKEEEKFARKFFSPLETMIFRYRVQAELSERNALYNVENKELTNHLLDFWNIEKSLPKAEALRMVKLMPYLNSIKGDKVMTADALGFILDQDIIITEVNKRTVADGENAMALDNMFLGVNSVTGINSNEVIYGWQVNFLNISPDNIEQYVDGAPIGRLLKRFSEIFIPVDRDVFFEFTISKPSETATEEYVLGYGCLL